MSYILETGQDEVLETSEDTYDVICPYCNEHIENKNIISMPWGKDDELRIDCSHCKHNFEIRPQYKFKGFFIYSDDEQMEEYMEGNNNEIWSWI